MIERCLQQNSIDVIPRVESENRLNGHTSLEEFILEELGFNEIGDAVYTKHSPATSSSQIPLFAAKDILAVDVVNTSIENKLKLLGYRFWHKEIDVEAGNYSLVKKLLPEGLIRVDDSVEDVLDSDDLINLYERVEQVENLSNRVVKSGPNYIERFRVGSTAVSKLISYGLSEQDILDLDSGINKYTYRATRQLLARYGEEDLNEVEFLGSVGLYAKEISGILEIPINKVYRYLSALYYDDRLKPQPEKTRVNQKFKNFVKKVEEMRSENEELSDLEIARLLGVSRSRVISANRILLLLGRIKPKQMSSSLRRYHGTEERISEVRIALREMYKEDPRKKIVMKDINVRLGTNYPISTLLKDYHKILKDEEVPSLKYNN